MMTKDKLPNAEDVWSAMEADGSKLGGDDSGKIYEKAKAIFEEAKGGKKKLVTVSAIRNSSEDEARKFRHPSIKPDPERSSSYGFNTTDHLNGIGSALLKKDLGTALEIVSSIATFTLSQVSSNLSQDTKFDISAVSALITSRCAVLEKLVGEFEEGRDSVFDLGRDQVLLIDGELHSITGFGESLARDIYQLYFSTKYGSKGKNAVKSQSVKSEDLLHTLEFENGGEKLKIQKNNADKYRREVEEEVITEMSLRVANAIAEDDVVFVGGYSPVLAYNTGFSELVAAVVAGASADAGLNTSLTIEKVIQLLSGDPRILNKYDVEPKPLKNVNPGFALNLMHEIMANTGVIESSGMRLALHKGVEVFVKAQDGGMTRIHKFDAEPGTVENVSLRKTSHINIDIDAFPLQDAGKIERMVDVWMRRSKLRSLVRHTSAGVVSCDIIGSVSKEQIEQLNNSLARSFDSEMKATVSNTEKALFCLGNNMNVVGVSKRAAAALKGIGISIERSKQGDQQVMIFMVPKEKAELALVAVHKLCIDTTNEEYDKRVADGETDESILGPLLAKWHELQNEE